MKSDAMYERGDNLGAKLAGADRISIGSLVPANHANSLVENPLMEINSIPSIDALRP